MTGRRVMWNEMAVDAARPAPLTRWEPNLSTITVRETERAAAAVQRFADHLIGAAEVAARLLLRSKGVASSAIERVRADAAAVALAEAAPGMSAPADAALWVADNLAVIGDAHVSAALDAERLLAWHDRLMSTTRTSPSLTSGLGETPSGGSGSEPHWRLPRPPKTSRSWMTRDVGDYQAGLTLYRQDQVDHRVSCSRQTAATAITALERRGILTALDTPATGRNPRERGGRLRRCSLSSRASRIAPAAMTGVDCGDPAR